MHYGIDHIPNRQNSLAAVPLPNTAECLTYVPVLPSIVWPSDARAYLNEVDADYKAFDLDVQKSTVDSAYKDGWAEQLTAWGKFYKDNIGVIAIGVAGIMDQTDRYACKLRKWRERFVQLGGVPVSPMPQTPGAGVPPSPTSPDPFGWIKTMAYIALGLGVIYLGIKVIPLIPKARPREPEPEPKQLPTHEPEPEPA